MKITGHTGLTCLLGSPVAHSISPAMHNESFRYHGLDYVYLAFDVAPERFEQAVEGLVVMNARGWNCTMPHKRLMYERADVLSKEAKLIGAVNTVVQKDGVLTGYNTDGKGYMAAVKDAGYDIIGQKMTLLGAGGAAASIMAQAALDGVPYIDLIARKGGSWDSISKVADRVNDLTSCKVNMYELQDTAQMKKSIEESRILVNASSVGMSPHEDGCLVPNRMFLHPELIVSDVIYHPSETKLLKMAKEAGCPAFNGMYMLLYQGAYAFELWTDKKMPVELIKEKYFA
ncbi:MAG TPA: quinate/shikimate dehydrogenase [Lachnospiraceae bacterium]|nr:quinate/shikimate dehydrogenase [Lachnospiraceae bacterium]